MTHGKRRVAHPCVHSRSRRRQCFTMHYSRCAWNYSKKYVDDSRTSAKRHNGGCQSPLGTNTPATSFSPAVNIVTARETSDCVESHIASCGCCDKTQFLPESGCIRATVSYDSNREDRKKKERSASRTLVPPRISRLFLKKAPTSATDVKSTIVVEIAGSPL